MHLDAGYGMYCGWEMYGNIENRETDDQRRMKRLFSDPSDSFTIDFLTMRRLRRPLCDADDDDTITTS
jgi:hypothetical protein